MVAVNTVGANAPIWKQQEMQAQMQGQNTTSVFEETSSKTGCIEGLISSECTDGKDDGKVGFLKGAVSLVKGAAKSVVNTVKDIATNPLKLIGTAAAITVGVLFPPVGVAMAVAGGAMGVYSLGKNAIAASKATTDLEKVALLENCGAAGLQVGLSVVGAKAGIKAMKGTSGSAMSQLSKDATLTQKAGAFVKDVKTGGNGNYKGAKLVDGIKTNGVRQTVKDGVANSKYGKAYNETAKTKIDAEGNTVNRGFADRALEARKTVGQENKLLKSASKEAKKQIKELDKAEKRLNSAQKEIDSYANQLPEQAGQTTKAFDKAMKRYNQALDDVSKAKASINADTTVQGRLAELELKSKQTLVDDLKSQLEKAPKNKTLQADYNKALTDLNNARVQVLRKEMLSGRLEASKVSPEVASQKAAQTKDFLNTDTLTGFDKTRATASYNGFTGLTASHAKLANNYTNLAKDAGYASSFGSLSTPVAMSLETANSNEKIDFIRQSANSAEAASGSWVNPLEGTGFNVSDNSDALFELQQQMNYLNTTAGI